MADSPDFAKLPPLAGFPEEVRDALRSRVRLRSLEPGDVLITEGHDAHAAYVVLEGCLDVSRDGVLVGRREPGEIVGEIGLFVGSRRTSTVTARTRVRVAEIDRVGFAELLDAAPSWSASIREEARRRFDEMRVHAALHACPSLPPSTHDALVPLAEARRFLPGEVIVQAGDPADSWWIVISGRAATQDTPPTVFVYGDAIGLDRVLARRPHSRTVRADNAVVAVRWPASAFEEVVAPDPAAIRQVAAQAISADVRGSRSEFRVVAVVTDGPHLATPLTNVTRELGLDPAVRLSSTHAARELGMDLEQPTLDELQEGRLSLWVAERARTASLALVEVPDPLNAWGRWALDQADQCLIVSRSEGYRGPPVHTSAPRHLVLVHPPSLRLPSGTRRAMEAVGASEVTHLREGRPSDLHRLARRLAGREVALVLAGGGARGYVHLGVLQALSERGIPVDRIGGTSAGGLVAAFAGRGESLEDTLALLERIEAGGGPTKYRASTTSLLDRERTLWLAETSWEGRDLEDLWLPVFCVTANLDTAERTILERGDLGVATRATAAVPVALPAVRVGEHWHVDGGILDNYPVGPMRERVGPGGRVIGVNLAVTSPAPLDREPGWFERVVLRRKADDPPSILDVLFRTIQVVTTSWTATEGLVDLEIVVDATDFDPRAFDRYREIIDHGLREARVQLDQAEARGLLRVFEQRERLALPLKG